MKTNLPVLNVLMRTSSEYGGFVAEIYEMGLASTGDTREEALGELEELLGVQIDFAREDKSVSIGGVPSEFAKRAMTEILAGRKDYEEKRTKDAVLHVYDFLSEDYQKDLYTPLK